MAKKVLVCVPVTTEQARLVANGQAVPGPLQVFTVTPMLLDTFGLQPNDHEEAEMQRCCWPDCGRCGKPVGAWC